MPSSRVQADGGTAVSHCGWRVRLKPGRLIFLEEPAPPPAVAYGNDEEVLQRFMRLHRSTMSSTSGPSHANDDLVRFASEFGPLDLCDAGAPRHPQDAWEWDSRAAELTDEGWLMPPAHDLPFAIRTALGLDGTRLLSACGCIFWGVDESPESNPATGEATAADDLELPRSERIEDWRFYSWLASDTLHRAKQSRKQVFSSAIDGSLSAAMWPVTPDPTQNPSDDWFRWRIHKILSWWLEMSNFGLRTTLDSSRQLSFEFRAQGIFGRLGIALTRACAAEAQERSVVAPETCDRCFTFFTPNGRRPRSDKNKYCKPCKDLVRREQKSHYYHRTQISKKLAPELHELDDELRTQGLSPEARIEAIAAVVVAERLPFADAEMVARAIVSGSRHT